MTTLESNDQYGHNVGDDVLRQIAAIFMQNSRENDVVARIGGDEFAIFTMSQAAACSLQFAEKLLIVVNAEKIHGLNITVSIGLAVSYKATLNQLFKLLIYFFTKQKQWKKPVC